MNAKSDIVKVRIKGCEEASLVILGSLFGISQTQLSLSCVYGLWPPACPHIFGVHSSRYSQPSLSPIVLRSTYTPALLFIHDSPPELASVSRKLWLGLLHASPPFSLSHTHAPLLLFDGPINCVVFNFFGHHNPSSSKTLSCFYWREGKNNRLFLRPLFFWASSGNTGLLVMITSAVITALIFFLSLSPFLAVVTEML